MPASCSTIRRSCRGWPKDGDLLRNLQLLSSAHDHAPLYSVRRRVLLQRAPAGTPPAVRLRSYGSRILRRRALPRPQELSPGDGGRGGADAARGVVCVEVAFGLLYLIQFNSV